MEAQRGDDTGMSFERLKALREQQWPSGKSAVDAIIAVAQKDGKSIVVAKRGGTFRQLRCASKPPCRWFVNLSASRRKDRASSWHVTSANFNHSNCTATPKPTVRQLAATSVLRTAVIADPDVSAPTLESQLQLDANLQCGRSTLYRAKHEVLKEIFSDDLESIEYLPSYLNLFAHHNPGTYTEVVRDKNGHFTRAIVVLHPDWFINGLRLFVDAAHMKHIKYNGVQVVLVARDGNLQNRVAAVALATLEDHASYLWFFSRVIAHDFELKNWPLFCDRHAGIISAAAELKLRTMFCTRHLLGNMRADKSVRLAIVHDGIVWHAQQAETKELYESALSDLTAVNHSAGTYVRGIDAAKWALHPHFGSTPLYGWRTTNFVESEQAKSLKLKPRLMLPYGYLCAYTKIMMAEAYHRLKHGSEWQRDGRVVTPVPRESFSTRCDNFQPIRCRSARRRLLTSLAATIPTSSGELMSANPLGAAVPHGYSMGFRAGTC